MPKRKKDGKGNLFYIRAASANDIARLACRFDYNSDLLFLSKTKQGGRLVVLGEKVGEKTIAYYTYVKGSGRFLQYTPASDESGVERVEFVDKTERQQGRYYISVIRTDLSGIEASKNLGKKPVELLRTESARDMICSVIKKRAKEETFAQLYSFRHGGKTLIGTFDLIDSLGKPAFFFSALDGSKPDGFARYDYREDRLDFTNVIGEHAYMYAKIINLAEPFPFFIKPKRK